MKIPVLPQAGRLTSPMEAGAPTYDEAVLFQHSGNRRSPFLIQPVVTQIQFQNGGVGHQG